MHGARHDPQGASENGPDNRPASGRGWPLWLAIIVLAGGAIFFVLTRSVPGP